MVSVKITKVWRDNTIRFSVDGVNFTVSREPLRLTGKSGLIQCANFNEWIAQRTAGFFMAHHLFAMAEAYKAGTTVGVAQNDVREYADELFNLTKTALFRDGLATYYVESYPRSVLPKHEVEKLVLGGYKGGDLLHICKGRGYSMLAERLGRTVVEETQSAQVTSDIGDMILKSRIARYLDERLQRS